VLVFFCAVYFCLFSPLKDRYAFSICLQLLGASPTDLIGALPLDSAGGYVPQTLCFAPSPLSKFLATPCARHRLSQTSDKSGKMRREFAVSSSNFNAFSEHPNLQINMTRLPRLILRQRIAYFSMVQRRYFIVQRLFPTSKIFNTFLIVRQHSNADKAILSVCPSVRLSWYRNGLTCHHTFFSVW